MLYKFNINVSDAAAAAATKNAREFALQRLPPDFSHPQTMYVCLSARGKALYYIYLYILCKHLYLFIHI